jgi:hypothetical protein
MNLTEKQQRQKRPLKVMINKKLTKNLANKPKQIKK